MTRIIPLLLCFFISAFGFSQKLISGRVLYQDSYQRNIDIINYTTKKATQTNNLGQFTIEAKVNDVLVFMSESFADQKYILTDKDLDKSTLLIKLIEKPIPLQEVEIRQVKAIKLSVASYNDTKMAKIQSDAGKPKNRDVYTGEIENGVDFYQIGKFVGKLFKSKRPKEVKAAPIPFTDYAKANFNESFFTKTLKLQPEETSRFLEYCQADPQAQTAMASNDELTMLEFLLTKKAEFDKLK